MCLLHLVIYALQIIYALQMELLGKLTTNLVDLNVS